MQTGTKIWAVVVMLAVALPACGSDGGGAADPEGAVGGGGSSDAGTDATADGAGEGDSDVEARVDAATGDGEAVDCTAARNELLGSVDAVSTGEVTVLQTSGASATLYIDASAGGAPEAETHPFVYVNLATRARVEVTDVTAASSTDWDLALKRSTLISSSGAGGPGQGGVAFFAGKSFDDVTAADAASATFAVEGFLDASCAPVVDSGGYPVTSFADWYDYDDATHQLRPRDGTFVVRGATGALHKLRIDSYYANPDGGPGQASGRFLVQVGAL